MSKAHKVIKVTLVPHGGENAEHWMNFRWVFRGPFKFRGRGVDGAWVTVPRREVRWTLKEK